MHLQVQKHSSQVRSAWRSHNIYDLRNSFLFCDVTLCRNIISGCFFDPRDATGNHQGLKEISKFQNELQYTLKLWSYTFVHFFIYLTVLCQISVTEHWIKCENINGNLGIDIRESGHNLCEGTDQVRLKGWNKPAGRTRFLAKFWTLVQVWTMTINISILQVRHICYSNSVYL